MDRFLSFYCLDFISLRWRHNDRDGVSNHRPRDCLLNHLFRRRSKKTSKLCVTGLCAGNSPGTGEFPAQMASYAENVSIWWRHHVSVLVRVWLWCKYKNMNILPTAQHLKAIIISLVSERLGYIMVLYQSSPWFPVHRPLSAIHHLLYKWFEYGNSKETGWIVLKFGSHIGCSVPSRDCRDMVVIELKMIEEKRVHSYALYFIGHLFLWNLWLFMMFAQYKFSWFWKYLLCPPIFNYTILKHSSVDNIILMWL